MRKRPVLAIVVLTAILSLLMAVPAAAGSRVRVYAGETSQGKPISFHVMKTDTGRRFLRGFRVAVTMTCEDATTEEWGMGFGFGGRGMPLTDGVFVDIDDVFSFDALHIHGRIGQLAGRGTFKFTVAQLTPDEQAQVCTTGDLTCQVEYTRTLQAGLAATRPALDGVMKVRVAPDGEVSTRVRSLG